MFNCITNSSGSRGSSSLCVIHFLNTLDYDLFIALISNRRQGHFWYSIYLLIVTCDVFYYFFVVDFLVSLSFVRSCKSTTTFLACKWFFAGVSTNVGS